jgi:hypothetical protein
MSTMKWRGVLSAAWMGLIGAALLAAAPASANDPECSVVDVDYAIATSLQLRDTRMGAADGVYPSGSGTLRLRVEGPPDASSREVRLVSFETRGRIEIAARALFWTTRVVTEARNSVRTEAGSTTARGALHDGVIRWSTPLSGYRSDGTQTCDGSMCGSFGAPASGTSPLHDGPHEVTLSPFVFSRDQRTFTMGYTLVSRTPSQSSYLALSGRETARRCAGAK